MAVALIATDTWLTRLLFTGGRRQTPYGPADGIWYGAASVAGDSGGGNVSLSLRLSEARKEDWVYVVGSVDAQVNADFDTEAFIQVNTGPLIPTTTAVTNPTFNVGGDMKGIANNAVSVFGKNDGGTPPFTGLPIFGDKRISGVFLMMAAGFQTNVDTALYTLSSWGWLFRYSSFFRNVSPDVG